MGKDSEGEADKSSEKNTEKKLKYAESLQGEVKKRYLSKLKAIDDLDPHEIPRKDWDTDASKGKLDVSIFPGITYPDILIYLSNTPSPHSLEDFKAYKSLEAFNYYNNGWVKDLKMKAVKEDVRIVSARVRKNGLLHFFSIQRCGRQFSEFIFGSEETGVPWGGTKKSPLGNQFFRYDPFGKLTPTGHNCHHPSEKLVLIP